MSEIFILFAGIVYGLIVGIIPVVGATTGLVALYPFMSYFVHDPYLGVIFCVAVVASSTTGDTFSGVLLGIPGANSAAATMIDGFPLALQGKATYALSAAFTVSTVNGLLWGSLTFLLLPFYAELILILGIPELLGLTLLALATVGFLSTKYWIRSMMAIALGMFIGMIGYNSNASPRWTFGWDYLLDGVQLIPVVVGLFAVPELLDGLKNRAKTSAAPTSDRGKQTIEGIKVAFRHWKVSLGGGVIGSIIGILPGIGGAMADWLAYGYAVASNSKEKFGNGNIKGVLGCEGANNAQKASSFIPTVLFGIPGAPFAAVLMALFMYLNFEMGTLELAQDTKFFHCLSFSFLWATAITGVLCLLLSKYIGYIAHIPYKYYFPLILSVVVWASMQYTGGWEDLAILSILSVLGILMKRFKFSRPAFLIAFILAGRVEKLIWQTFKIYDIGSLMQRPIFLGLCALIGVVTFLAYKNKNKLEYN
jgi:TctA family transporter